MQEKVEPVDRLKKALHPSAALSPSRCVSGNFFGRTCRPYRSAHRGQGLNLAVSDVRYLSRALIQCYPEKSDAGIDLY